MSRRNRRRGAGKQSKGQQRPRIAYKTPGRECPHADKGCCPKCEKPTRVNIVRGFTVESVAHS